MVKKILLGLVAFVVLLLITAFAAPVLFKGKIMDAVKTGINGQLNAKIDFADVDISLFKHFPRLTFGLTKLSVTGVGAFEGDSLLSVSSFDISLDLMSVIGGGQMKIYGIELTDPRIHALAKKDGTANWNITKPTSDTAQTTTENKPFQLNLKEYTIKNGYISYIDEVGNMSAEIDGLNHSGSGDFSSDLFTLITKTSIDGLSYSMGGVSYLKKAKASIGLDLNIDNPNKKFSFETDKIQLNDLQLTTGGFFQLVNDTTFGMDIKFKAPSTEFKSILSFVPSIYQNNFASIKTSGSVQVNGYVKGNYNSKQLPAFHTELSVKDGFFQYPDLPEPVKNINVALLADNPDGVPDHTTVDISNGHIELAGEPFDFKVIVKTPISDMFVNASAKGKLDLSKVTKFVKLENGTSLSGLLDANAEMSGNMNALKAKQYDKFHAAGTLGLSAFNYVSKDYPDGIKLNTFLMTFNPKNVTLNNMDGRYQTTDFSANGYLNNLLAYALKNEPLEGVVNLKAGVVDVNKLMGAPTAKDTSKATSAQAPFAVPANLNLALNANVAKVLYDKFNIDALSGSITVADEKVSLNNVKGNALDGQIIINGFYSTKANKLNPEISFAYNVSNVDIQKSFGSFVTVQKLLPVAQYISGRISSQFTMKGNLGKDLAPDVASIIGNGNLSIANGVLSKFTPVAKVSQTLGLKQTQALQQDYPIKDLKGIFQFANGRMLVQPFKLKAPQGIDMEIGGSNGIDKSIDYTVNMKLPRALLGSQGNNLLNGLTAQAASKGMAVKVNDIVNLQVKLGGLISDPTVKTDFKQAANNLAQDLKQQAVDMAKAKVDSTKKAVTTAVKDTIKRVQQQVVNDVKTQVMNQILKKDSGAPVSDPKKTIEDAGKGLLKGLNPFKRH